MFKHKFTKVLMLLLIIIVSNIFILIYANLIETNIMLSYNVTSDTVDTFQVFYSENSNWTEECSLKSDYVNPRNEQELKYNIPINARRLRLDLGNQISVVKLSDIELTYYGKTIKLDVNMLLDIGNSSQIQSINKNGEELVIITSGTDPYIIVEISDKIITNLINYKDMLNYALKLILCVVMDVLLYLVIKRSKSVFVLVQDLYNSRILIWSLSKNDFKTKYAGSYLGIIWAFIQPMITILVYWLVFEFGLRVSSPTEDTPFILWFSVGLIPWFFFSDAINNAMNSFVEYSYLVKKVVFKISVLPIVKVVSSLFVHFVFLVFIIVLLGIYGFYPTKYIIQLVYYVICTIIIVLGISYMTSAIVLFFKDLGQIINVLLQIGMWATPIMWSYRIVPDKYQWIIKLNPMYYIVEGYRDTFINNIWFYQKYFQTIYFWIITLVIFNLGAIIFKKLKPHFADVL